MSRSSTVREILGRVHRGEINAPRAPQPALESAVRGDLDSPCAPAAVGTGAHKLGDEHEGACKLGEHPVASKILLVGEDNPLSDDPRYSLWPDPPRCAGHNLQSKILGLSMGTYLATWRTNLCVGAWDDRAAHARALELGRSEHPWRTIVLLGRRVAQAFAPWTGRVLGSFEQRYLGETEMEVEEYPTIVSLPHPSGRCLLWNVPQNIVSARMVLHHVEPAMPWGELD